MAAPMATNPGMQPGHQQNTRAPRLPTVQPSVQEHTRHALLDDGVYPHMEAKLVEPNTRTEHHHQDAPNIAPKNRRPNIVNNAQVCTLPYGTPKFSFLDAHMHPGSRYLQIKRTHVKITAALVQIEEDAIRQEQNARAAAATAQ